MCCSCVYCRKWVIVTVGCLSVLCTLSLCMYLTTTALFSRPLAPGLYLLLSLTVMKPAFKEQGAGSEASQIRSVKRLAGWAWWMRARMSFCRGCIVKSFHCHRRAYENLMNKGASVRNGLPLLPPATHSVSSCCLNTCLLILPFVEKRKKEKKPEPSFTSVLIAVIA